MSSLVNWFGARGLHLYSWVMTRTARYQIVGQAHLEALLESGRPTIWTSWHGMTMMMAGYALQRQAGVVDDIHLIIPDDWRGEALLGWANLAGAKALTISLDEGSLVAARRLIELVKQLKQGKQVYMNPDGPDGPAGVPKAGISFLAARSGAAVLPVGLYTKTRYELRRWDRYSLPFPYSRITLVIGEPLTIGRKEETETAGKRIAAAINQVLAEAKKVHLQE